MRRYSHLDIGQMGERAAIELYKRQGYELVAQNYWRPFGEIDAVLRKDEELVFVEVKSVSRVTFSSESDFNPAENIHSKKRSRLRRVVSAFLKEEIRGEVVWRFDVAIVQVNTKLKRSRVEVIEDVVL